MRERLVDMVNLAVLLGAAQIPRQALFLAAPAFFLLGLAALVVAPIAYLPRFPLKMVGHR
jgi:hypothetical protein